MREYLGSDIPLFSMIVFSEHCELNKIILESDNIPVIKRDQLFTTVQKIWDSTEDRLDQEKVEMVYKKLKILTQVDQAVKEAHIQNINQKYKRPEKTKRAEAVEAVKKQEETLICPRCGGNLILRVARKGTNVGKHFYGCANYPKCRYVRDTD